MPKFTRMAIPEYDKALWFEHLGCSGKHYLIGNPHTVPGRMWAWCPKEQCTIFISKADMGKMSKSAEYWVNGFLSGNEPEPPVDEEGDIDFKSKAYKAWQRNCRQFTETGKWK